jgi:2-polyprenyl-6-methoxyphenol hydroxylase-like FAD-dependent oxidoreductase
MLACELRLAGVATMPIDRMAERGEVSRAGGVHARTLEILDQRGLLEPLLATGGSPQAMGPHFAGLPLRAGAEYEGRYIQQTVVEEFLEKQLAETGTPVLRPYELVGLEAGGSGVTATLADGRTIRAAYLVAADGAHSTVRSVLGAAFPGRPGTSTSIVADVRLDGAPPRETWGSGGNWARGADGSTAALFPGIGGLTRLGLFGPGNPADRSVPVTEAEIRAGLLAAFGPEVRLEEVRYAFRITDVARQVERYRHGRVFFAGDAAHVHLPLGGQGMNTGMQDAVNLGWKLAAAVNGWGSEELLDSYHDERHPVGARLLRNVQTQSLVVDMTGSGNPDLVALRELFAELAQAPEVGRHLAGMVAGTDVRYPMPGAGEHPLLGRRAPDLDLGDGTRLRERLRSGKGLLVGPDLAARWADRVDRVPAPGDDALLVRPDGHVCWAATGPGDPAVLEGVLTRWFGPARTK